MNKYSLALMLIASASAVSNAQTLMSLDWEAPGWSSNSNVLPHSGLTGFGASQHAVRTSGTSVAGSVVNAVSGSQFHVSTSAVGAGDNGRIESEFGALWASRNPQNFMLEYTGNWFLPTNSTADVIHGFGLQNTSSGILIDLQIRPASGQLVLNSFQPASTAVPRDQWFSVRFLVNSSNGNLDLFVNNNTVFSGSYFQFTPEIGGFNFYNLNVTGVNRPSSVASDNHRIRAIPSPAGAALLLGALASGSRRRRD